jgi:hypothetical protein
LLAALHAICWYGEILWHGVGVVLLQQPNKKLQNSFYVMKLRAKETAKNKKEILKIMNSDHYVCTSSELFFFLLVETMRDL